MMWILAKAFSIALLWVLCLGDFSEYEGKLVKGNRNAVFLVQEAKRKSFPDFYTFTSMGFKASDINKIPDDILNSIPLGEMIKPVPVFRPEDYMYHSQCDDPDRMVNDLGLVPNMGNFMKYINVLKRIQKKKSIDILALGGSITAGGYFLEFTRLLEVEKGLNVTVHNHGHGATELTYSIFCVDIDKYSPDLVLIDFAVNDYGHPKLMDALIRKVSIMKSKPIVALVTFFVHRHCPVPRYLLHSFYYQIPLINVCPAVTLCYGKDHLPKYIWEKYSKTDGIHPWGEEGVKFLGKLLYAWWNKLEQVATSDVTMDVSGKMVTHTHSFDSEGKQDFLTGTIKGNYDQFDGKALSDSRTTAGYGLIKDQFELPPPLYVNHPIGLCTRCEALADDADSVLKPIGQNEGFRVVTRVKIGYGGFNPKDKTKATKSFKRSWQADTPGSVITFPFYGSAVKIGIWQRRDGMGILNAFVDNDRSKIAQASGFFKGYTWDMARNNTGRSEIITLFEGLEDKLHSLTLEVSEEPANKWVKGHLVQVFAILSASDHAHCKNISFH